MFRLNVRELGSSAAFLRPQYL